MDVTPSTGSISPDPQGQVHSVGPLTPLSTKVDVFTRDLKVIDARSYPHTHGRFMHVAIVPIGRGWPLLACMTFRNALLIIDPLGQSPEKTLTQLEDPQSLAAISGEKGSFLFLISCMGTLTCWEPASGEKTFEIDLKPQLLLAAKQLGSDETSATPLSHHDCYRLVGADPWLDKTYVHIMGETINSKRRTLFTYCVDDSEITGKISMNPEIWPKRAHLVGSDSNELRVCVKQGANLSVFSLNGEKIRDCGNVPFITATAPWAGQHQVLTIGPDSNPRLIDTRVAVNGQQDDQRGVEGRYYDLAPVGCSPTPRFFALDQTGIFIISTDSKQSSNDP